MFISFCFARYLRSSAFAFTYFSPTISGLNGWNVTSFVFPRLGGEVVNCLALYRESGAASKRECHLLPKVECAGVPTGKVNAERAHFLGTTRGRMGWGATPTRLSYLSSIVTYAPSLNTPSRLRSLLAGGDGMIGAEAISK